MWVRGILAEHHGEAVESMTHLTGGQERPGRIEKQALDLPERIRVERIAADRTLSGMLADGTLDALVTPRIPRPFVERGPRVRRLFPDVVAAERAYFAATGIFPIMHMVLRARTHRDTLATFLRYHHEQGLSERLLRPEELFAPEATESAVV